MGLFGFLFGKKGHQAVINDLSRVVLCYREITLDEHRIREDLERVFAMERREAELRKKISQLRSMGDAQGIADEGRRVLREELRYLHDAEHRINRCIHYINEQKRKIRNARRGM